MPCYEYRCRKCGQLREEFHRHEEIVYLKCYQCNGAMDRIISAPNFILPVYRHSELIEKNDGGSKDKDKFESRKHYTEKLNLIKE
jgi:putative FmdB family regulatory protein